MVVIKWLNGLEKTIVSYCWLTITHLCLTKTWTFGLFILDLIVLVLKRLHFGLTEHIFSIYCSFEH